MAKQSGLGGALWISGYDVSGDIQQFTTASPAQTHDVTGIDKAAMERILGQRDGSIDMTTFFNPSEIAGDSIHQRLSPLPTADQLVTAIPVAVALGGPAASLVAKQLNYDMKRAQSGEVLFEMSAQSNGYGIEWGKLLTAGVRTDTAATNGPGVDMGDGSGPGFTGPSNFGLQAYLHMFEFTGTSVTVKLQESADNGVGDAWADVAGGSFAAATGVTFQRIVTAGNLTVEKYLRVVTSGTFSNAKFAVIVNRNDVATVF
ncbi:MAG TPA: hypothetical protein VFG15_06345 [Amycolatopsis sp.]|nr:hypothetical protein [Amycolatopsis sp.]